jgi:hypothetical protein
MIISHKYKFILIDIPKTASTCLNKYLIPHLGPLDHFSFPRANSLGIESVGTPLPKNMRHAKYEELMPEFSSCSNYLVACCFRNPWDRVISYLAWLYRSKCFGIKHNMILNQMIPRNLSYMLNAQASPLAPQVSWITYNDSMPNNIFILKFENLQEDFNSLCAAVGIPSQNLEYINTSEHQHYSKYYCKKTKEICAKKYAKDIEYFGYTF